jgi:hypothetical protein
VRKDVYAPDSVRRVCSIGLTKARRRLFDGKALVDLTQFIPLQMCRHEAPEERWIASLRAQLLT